MASHAPAPKENNKKGLKKRLNLGLGEQNAIDESSEEEDVDEEAAFAEKVKIEGVAFEHNGEVISLQTAADVQSYIKDRRRNFPTQHRIAEKAKEAAAKREHELEFLRRVHGKPHKTATEIKQPKLPKPERKPTELDNRKREELAALRKKLHESMVKKQQPPTNLLGLGYDSETDSDAESSVLSESSVVSSSEESSDDESDEQDSDSDAPLNQHRPRPHLFLSWYRRLRLPRHHRARSVATGAETGGASLGRAVGGHILHRTKAQAKRRAREISGWACLRRWWSKSWRRRTGWRWTLSSTLVRTGSWARQDGD